MYTVAILYARTYTGNTVSYFYALIKKLVAVQSVLPLFIIPLAVRCSLLFCRKLFRGGKKLTFWS
jgi:hypothetical protein